MDVPLGGLQDSWQFKDVACNKKGLALVDLHHPSFFPTFIMVFVHPSSWRAYHVECRQLGRQ